MPPTERGNLMGIISASDPGLWLIGATGVGSLTATFMLLVRWPRIRVKG